MNDLAFIPPRDGHFYLLREHRQPLPENVVRQLVAQYSAPGDLILDPFAASDVVARVAVEMGRRAILTDSNPLVAFAARAQAALPAPRDISAVLARVGEIHKEDETLQTHIDKLYASECAHCGAAVIVDYFVHRREGDHSLIAEKVYACDTCGARRDDATETDRQRAGAVAPRGLHYHLLMQRLVADDAQHSALLRRLLSFYSSRNLYALAFLTQKLDADFHDDPAQRLANLFLLHALDVGTSLYPTIEGLPQREIPAEFVERNIWRTLDCAAHGLSERAPGIQITSRAADVISSSAPAAHIGHGGARVLAESIMGANARLILSSPARLAPSFWELSFLWTRWLLGKTAASSLDPLLDEKRQRWSWYGSALVNSLADAATMARDDAHLVAVFPSGSHAMIEALLLAAAPQHELDGLAFRPQRGALKTTEFGALRGDYCVRWRKMAADSAPRTAQEIASDIRAGALKGAIEILDARGEPLAYSWLHHNALDGLARGGVLAQLMGAKMRAGDNPFQFLRHRLEEGFKEGYAHDLDHWQDKTRVLWMKRPTEDEGRKTKDEGNAPSRQTVGVGSSGFWRDGTLGLKTIADRVEQVVRDELGKRQEVKIEDLEDVVLEAFPGLLTPEIELVELCVKAYAELVDVVWVKRADHFAEFVSNAQAHLRELGQRLGFQVQTGRDSSEQLWRAEKIVPGSSKGAVQATSVVEDAYRFVVRARADFADLVSHPVTPLRGFIVIPECQVALTKERLRRDPRWIKRLQRAGWEFLRMPYVEQFLSEELTERPEFELIWGLEPAVQQGKEQMKLL